jgi:predicted phosphatase
MASFCDDHNLPFIQGYYINLDSRKDEIQTIQELKTHEQIIASLKRKANLEMIVIQLSYNLPTKAYSALKNRLTA